MDASWVRADGVQVPAMEQWRHTQLGLRGLPPRVFSKRGERCTPGDPVINPPVFPQPEQSEEYEEERGPGYGGDAPASASEPTDERPAPSLSYPHPPGRAERNTSCTSLPSLGALNWGRPENVGTAEEPLLGSSEHRAEGTRQGSRPGCPAETPHHHHLQGQAHSAPSCLRVQAPL